MTYESNPYDQHDQFLLPYEDGADQTHVPIPEAVPAQYSRRDALRCKHNLFVRSLPIRLVSQ